MPHLCLSALVVQIVTGAPLAVMPLSLMPLLAAETPEGLRLIPWSGLDVQMRAFVQSRQYQDALHT